MNQELLLKTIEKLGKRIGDMQIDMAVMQTQLEMLQAEMDAMRKEEKEKEEE